MLLKIDGEQVEITRIGTGSFSKVYRCKNGRVYCFVEGDDYSKEAIALFSEGRHIPAIERHNDVYLPRVGWCNVYSMPFYDKLTNKKVVNCPAKRQALDIKKLWETYYQDNWHMLRGKNNRYGDLVWSFIKYADGRIPESLHAAVVSIYSACANYGDYFLEFPIRNMAMDADGELVLLDIVYNPKAL